MYSVSLIGPKKYLVSCVTRTIIESSVNKLKKYFKLSTIIFATIPSQIMMFYVFFASGTKLPKNYLICFHAWFVKSLEKTVEIYHLSTALLRYI